MAASQPVYRTPRYLKICQALASPNLKISFLIPKMASLFSTMSLDRITVDEAEQLLQLPRSLGQDPADGKEIVSSNAETKDGKNIGGPRADWECDWFATMMEKSRGDKVTAGEVAVMREDLEVYSLPGRQPSRR